MLEKIFKGTWVLVVLIGGVWVYDKIKPNDKFQLCGNSMDEMHLSNKNEKDGKCIELGNTFGATIDDNGNILLKQQ